MAELNLYPVIRTDPDATIPVTDGVLIYDISSDKRKIQLDFNGERITIVDPDDIDKAVAAEAAIRRGQVDGLSGRIDETNQALDDAYIESLDYDPATRVLSIKRNDGTEVSETLPQASTDADGLMTTADVATILDLVKKVESIEGGGVWRLTVDTFAALNSTFPGLDVTATSWERNDWVEVTADETRSGQTTSYIVNQVGDTLVLAFRRIETLSISVATNTSLGVVKGTLDMDGKIYVETDGSMSLVGWDALNATVANKQNALTTQQLENISDVPNKLARTETAADSTLFQGMTPAQIIAQAEDRGLRVQTGRVQRPLASPGMVTVQAPGMRVDCVIISRDFPLTTSYADLDPGCSFKVTNRTNFNTRVGTYARAPIEGNLYDVNYGLGNSNSFSFHAANSEGNARGGWYSYVAIGRAI